MTLKIRLARAGAKKRPYYRIVVADSRSPRDGRFIERVGTYDPLLRATDPDRVQLKEERIRHWLGVGARPSDRVARFLGVAEIAPMPAQRNNPKKALPKKKAQERLQAEAEAAAAPPPEAKAEPEVEEAAAEPVAEEAAAEPVAEEAAAEPVAEEAAAEPVAEEAAAEPAAEETAAEPVAEEAAAEPEAEEAPAEPVAEEAAAEPEAAEGGPAAEEETKPEEAKDAKPKG